MEVKRKRGPLDGHIMFRVSHETEEAYRELRQKGYEIQQAIRDYAENLIWKLKEKAERD